MKIAESTATANPPTVLQVRRMFQTREWIDLPSSKPGGTGLYSQLQERLRQGVNKSRLVRPYAKKFKKGS